MVTYILNVEKLDINHSTHITQIKDIKQQECLKQKYPFIQFCRPNIKEIITNSIEILNYNHKDIAILVNGPNSLVNDVRFWSKKFKIDCHFEKFEW